MGWAMGERVEQQEAGVKQTAGIAALFAVAGVVWAAPITVGTTLTNQRFEWKSSYSSRSAGTYGQYEVGLTAGVTYEILTSNIVAGTSGDPYLYLLSTSGVVLAQDDDSAGSNNAKIVFTPTASGTYWIRLRAYHKGKYGTCSLTVREQAPTPPPVEVVIRPGDVLNDQIFEWRSQYTYRYEGTYGQYRIDMAAGTTYTFETSNSVGGGSDTYLYLLNSALQVVAYDDDAGAGYHSRLTYQPSAGATYYLRLRAYTKGASGTCRLTCTGATLPPGNPLYPDLICWVYAQGLRDAYISIEGGVRKLRFSNTVANRGAGALELYGVVDGAGTTQAYQNVYNDNGSKTTYQVGTFSFAGHESHNHWHFDDFAVYELRTLSGALVATSDKVSFCLLDYARYTAESIPGAPASAVYTCSNQGISIGWADVYGAGLEGQYIVITGVPDGTYRLVSITDPFDRLHEEPRTNNTGEVTLTISGSTVTVP